LRRLGRAPNQQWRQRLGQPAISSAKNVSLDKNGDMEDVL
jgi:hypothetical protein